MPSPFPQPVDSNPLDQSVKSSPGFSIRSDSLFSTGNISVLWDVNECPIPATLKDRHVFNNIKKVLGENGYFGPVNITPCYDLLNTDLVEVFEAIPVSFLPAGDRDIRLDHYLMYLFFHAIDTTMVVLFH